FSITAVIAYVLGSVCAPLVFLALYNSLHLWVRGAGFVHGVRGRLDLMRYIKRMEIPNLSVRLKKVMLVLLGLLAAGLGFFLPLPTILGQSDWMRAVPVVVVCIVGFLVKKGVGLLIQIYTFSAIVILLCWFLSLHEL
ncbi:MAG: hypothetical protein L0213_04635, partial [Candidatus Dadabacteria bacterium]|nr:hypothetical protein [Candidatus Dadabacteria bacterium]